MNKETAHDSFLGFRSPNTTPIPDELFDELLPILSGAELKVLLYICRRTFGWKKDSDNISLNQMVHGIIRKDGVRLDGGVGLSKPTLLRTIKSLIIKNIIFAVRRESKEKGNEPTNYRLNMQEGKNTDTPLGKKMILGESQNFTKPLVKKSTPQETVIQQTINKTVPNVRNEKESILKNLPDLDQPLEKTRVTAQDVAQKLGDQKSARFFILVAKKIPEEVIYQALAEVKEGTVRNPPALFTTKMSQWAQKYYLAQNKKKLLEGNR